MLMQIIAHRYICFLSLPTDGSMCKNCSLQSESQPLFAWHLAGPEIAIHA